MASSFSNTAIKQYDQFMRTLYEINNKHPLSELLYQSVMSVREILCCWQKGNLDHTAFESLNTRFEMQKAYMDEMKEDIKPSFEIPIIAKSGLGGYGKKLFSFYDKCLCFRSNETSSFNRIIDLRRNQIEVVPILKAASEAEFKVLNITANKTYLFKLPTDRERVMCIEGLKSYQRRRVIQAHIISLSIKDRLKLYLEDLYDPNVPVEKQFLTSTIDPNQPDPFATTGRQSFDCGIPKVIGDNKPRIIQLYFDEKKIMIFKKGDNNPYIQLQQAQLIDYKVTKGKDFDITLHIQRSKKHNAKNFRFRTEDDLNRFVNALELFRQFNHGFLLYHATVLGRFRDLDESEMTARQQTWRPAARSVWQKSNGNIFEEDKKAEVSNLNMNVSSGGPPPAPNMNASSGAPPPAPSINLSINKTSPPRSGSGSSFNRAPPPGPKLSVKSRGSANMTMPGMNRSPTAPAPMSLSAKRAPPPASSRSSIQPSMPRSPTAPMMGGIKKQSMMGSRAPPSPRSTSSRKVPTPRSTLSRAPPSPKSSMKSFRKSSRKVPTPRSTITPSSSSRAPPPAAPGSGRGPPPATPGSGRGPPPSAPGSGRGPPPSAPGSGRGPPPKAPGSGRGPPPKAPGSGRGPPPKAPGSGRGPPPKAPGSGRGPPPGAPGKKPRRPAPGPPRNF